MSNSFNEKRRQQFITENFGENQINRRNRMEIALREEMVLDDTDKEGLSLLTASFADNAYERLSLRFTYGIPIEDLRTELTGIIEAYERYQKALADYEEIPKVAPLRFRDPGDYERAMQLIGLCYLLHRRDLLPRIAALLDPAYYGKDTFYEELLDYGLPERDTECEELYHVDLYDILLDAMYEETVEERTEAIKKYLLAWYPSFKYVPWHDGHLHINGDEGDYFGYWAFEAGAVAYLCDIDDSGIDHMVYPKDLVAWARQHKTLSEADDGMVPLRCEANQPCPQTGIWSIPANPDARRLFKAGDLMPDFPNSSYGKTIWYWDENQNE